MSTTTRQQMKEWVHNELYAELMSMPLWTLAAYNSLKDGDSLSSDDPRYKLLTILASNHIQKVPDSIYDAEYRTNWKTSDFIECVKAAVNILTKTR